MNAQVYAATEASEGHKTNGGQLTFIVNQHQPDHHFRTEIPNIILDIGLPIGAGWLYAYYKRVAGGSGACWKCQKAICRELGISPATYIKYRDELTKPRDVCGGKPLISVTTRKKEDGSNDTTVITIIDIWRENGDYYRAKKQVTYLPGSKYPLASTQRPKKGGHSKSERGVIQNLNEGHSKSECRRRTHEEQQQQQKATLACDPLPPNDVAPPPPPAPPRGGVVVVGRGLEPAPPDPEPEKNRMEDLDGFKTLSDAQKQRVLAKLGRRSARVLVDRFNAWEGRPKEELKAINVLIRDWESWSDQAAENKAALALQEQIKKRDDLRLENYEWARWFVDDRRRKSPHLWGREDECRIGLDKVQLMGEKYTETIATDDPNFEQRLKKGLKKMGWL